VVELLFKKGDRTVTSNYRPVSIWTPFQKSLKKSCIIDYSNT
jgi:hypothetical protein